MQQRGRHAAPMTSLSLGFGFKQSAAAHLLQVGQQLDQQLPLLRRRRRAVHLEKLHASSKHRIMNDC